MGEKILHKAQGELKHEFASAAEGEEGDEGGETCRNDPVEQTCEKREILHARAYKSS